MKKKLGKLFQMILWLWEKVIFGDKIAIPHQADQDSKEEKAAELLKYLR